jgi:putative membrane protein
MTKLGTYCAAIILFAVGGRVSAEVKPVSKPEDFLARATEWAAIEKDLAQTAVKSAASEDVRKFAQRLAEEHARCEKELADISKEQKIAVAVTPNKAERDKVQEIGKLKGNDFDRRFLAFVVESHEKALKMLDNKDLKDEKCRAAAARATDQIRKDIEEARALQKKLGF